jgi:DNA-binding Xre family transcriptional regulator
MNKLATMRVSKKISQKELSKLTGITQAAISNIETDKTDNAGIKTYKKLAEALKCKIDDIV